MICCSFSVDSGLQQDRQTQTGPSEITDLPAAVTVRLRVRTISALSAAAHSARHALRVRHQCLGPVRLPVPRAPACGSRARADATPIGFKLPALAEGARRAAHVCAAGGASRSRRDEHVLCLPRDAIALIGLADGGQAVRLFVCFSRHFALDLDPPPPRGAALARRSRSRLARPHAPAAARLASRTVFAERLPASAVWLPPAWMGGAIGGPPASIPEARPLSFKLLRRAARSCPL